MGTALRTLIKNSLSINILLYDKLLRTYYKAYNNEIIKIVNELSLIDSIMEFDQFRNAILNVKFPTTSGTYTIKRAYSENTLYGYALDMMKYAGLMTEEIEYFPLVFHGIPYSDNFSIGKFGFHNSFIFQGKYDEARVLKKYPSKKLYEVGPYIFYSKNYYDEKKIKKIKESLGKTALIFLSHSAEGSFAKLQIEQQIQNVKLYSKKTYKTFMVCVYCMDVEQVMPSELTNNDVKYVCAGYKLDPLFSSRLKTILSLADDVFFDSFSSSIGYAFLMNKGVYSIKEFSDEKCVGREDTFHTLFKVSNNISDDERRAFIEKYWGLSLIKTKEEIQSIYYENKDRIRKRKGFFDKFSGGLC